MPTLKRIALFLSGVLATLATMLALSQDGQVAGVSVDPEEQVFISLLNDWRAQNNVPPVLVDIRLQAGAEWKANDMAQSNVMSHTDSLGRPFYEMLCVEAEYCYNTYKGENIAAGYATGATVFNGWKTSPGHNSNMLKPEYNATGIGLVELVGSTYRYWWASEFGGFLSEPLPTPTPIVTPTLAPPAACPLDLNGDRVINALDLTRYPGAMPSKQGDANYDPLLDLNGNGVINTLDLVGYANALNTTCPQ